MAGQRLEQGVFWVAGGLLIAAGAFHLYRTPAYVGWLSRNLIENHSATLPRAFLLDHLLTGLILIPIGVTLLYSASRMAAGRQWPRILLAINAPVVVLVPLLCGGVLTGAVSTPRAFAVVAIVAVVSGVLVAVGAIALLRSSEDPE